MDLLTSAPFLKAGLKQSLNILIGINYSDLHHALEEVNGSPEEFIVDTLDFISLLATEHTML